ncbi:MAG TPA: RtcB family protein [Gemmataceae bacterium]|nr:RtcB family protein [Gemmataceae bacterium]
MKSPSDHAVVRRWLAEPLPADVTLAIDRLAQTEDVRHIAVMPDVHLSEEVCTGTVVATGHRLLPHAVGSDIGCGMAAVCFAAPADLLDDERAAARLLAGLYRVVPTMRHPRATLRDRLPAVLDDAPLSHPSLDKLKQRDGRVQFATLGRGNHFLEFQADTEGLLWLMVHSGSRALGQAITVQHLGQAESADTGVRFLDADSPAGLAYLHDMEWACAYADQSRQAMIEAVAALMLELFGVAADTASLIRCNHNHVRRETHLGTALWVHRKGAVSAQQGEAGIIPGSMGTLSFHVEGRGCNEALCSSSHGAGRLLSRTEARQTVSVRDLEREMKGVWFDHRLAERLRDEAPRAYKDVRAVMRAQRDLTRIVRELRPILSYKGA